MSSLILILLFLGVLLLGWIRFAPTDPDDWHVDPAEVSDPEGRGYRLIGRDAPRFPGHPDDVLNDFYEVAKATRGVRLLDGRVDEGMITLVARSKWMGFRDYVTVKAVGEGPETKLSMVSRSRYAFGSDWGVNRDRLEHWLAELEQVLVQGRRQTPGTGVAPDWNVQ